MFGRSVRVVPLGLWWLSPRWRAAEAASIEMSKRPVELIRQRDLPAS